MQQHLQLVKAKVNKEGKEICICNDYLKMKNMLKWD